MDVSSLLRFESLGDSCELTAVQRHAGLSPRATLLGDAGISLTELEAGLARGFAGVGEPCNTELAWWPPWREYQLRDTRYFRTHTGRFACSDDAEVNEAARLQSALVMRLLRRRLIDNIAQARRIFVFKTADPEFDAGRMHHLHGLLRRIGPAALLCVTLADDPGDVGQVLACGDGLFAGRIDRFGDFPPHQRWSGSFEVWQQLLHSTIRLHGNA